MKQSVWTASSGLLAVPVERNGPNQSPENERHQTFSSKGFASLNRSPIRSDEQICSLGFSEAVPPILSPSYPAHCPPDRPHSRQHFGGAPAAVEQQVVTQSLRNENELLRVQLREVSQQERQQRTQLAHLRQHHDNQVAQRVQEQMAGCLSERNQLQAALEAAEVQLTAERAERERLAQQLEEQTCSAVSGEQRGAHAVRRLEAVVASSAAAVAELASGVEAFQQSVLPTFMPPPEGTEGQGEDACLEGDRHGLGKQVARLGRALRLLRLMVDAKSDTLVLIRSQLKAQAQTLQAQVAELQGQAHHTHSALRHQEQGAEEERGQLRAEVDALQELYSAEVHQLQARVAAFERGEAGEVGALSGMRRELRLTGERVAALEGANARLAATLEEESGMRGQVVAQLAAQKKETAATRSELETLKLSQKFLVRQPRGGARIPAEKMDLMNMVNHLLQEVSKLKAEKVAVEEELKGARHAQVVQRAQTAFTHRDVALAAADKVHDAEIAVKLMRQRLQPNHSEEGRGHGETREWAVSRMKSDADVSDVEKSFHDAASEDLERQARESVRPFSTYLSEQTDALPMHALSSSPNRTELVSQQHVVRESLYYGAHPSGPLGKSTSKTSTSRGRISGSVVLGQVYSAARNEARVLSPQLPERD